MWMRVAPSTIDSCGRATRCASKPRRRRSVASSRLRGFLRRRRRPKALRFVALAVGAGLGLGIAAALGADLDLGAGAARACANDPSQLIEAQAETRVAEPGSVPVLGYIPSPFGNPAALSTRSWLLDRFRTAWPTAMETEHVPSLPAFRNAVQALGLADLDRRTGHHAAQPAGHVPGRLATAAPPWRSGWPRRPRRTASAPS